MRRGIVLACAAALVGVAGWAGVRGLAGGDEADDEAALMARLDEAAASVVSAGDVQALDVLDDRGSYGGVSLEGELRDVPAARARLDGAGGWRRVAQSGDGTLLTYRSTSGEPCIEVVLDTKARRLSIAPVEPG